MLQLHPADPVNVVDNEKGASAVEYGLLVAAIAAIIVLIVFAIGKFVKAGFTTHVRQHGDRDDLGFG